MELKQEVIEINYNVACTILNDLEKKKYYWGDRLLRLYRGHKNYIKGTYKMSKFDLEWYVKAQIKSILNSLEKGQTAYFKISVI